MNKKRYAQVGIGGRARFFYEAIVKDYSKRAKLVAFCDINQTRMDYANEIINGKYGIEKVNTYKYTQFDEMIKKEKPDTIIVTSIDRTHHKYIIRAMELGCDVVSEKPMTIDENKAQAILDTIKKTGKKLRVTFNYRYAPHNTKLKELIMDGTIGDVNSVHFEWLLNTQHGADYFRRWHRDKKNSGGLLVHKSTHHFDLVNFWLDTRPKTVYAMGDLMFYGKENAENRGVENFYYRAYGSDIAKDDPFALNLEDSKQLKKMYLDAEKEDGYLRDQSVFGDGISIEDTMGIMVGYDNNAIMTYSLNAYMPWEGFRVCLNGSKGRIQMTVVESTYVNAKGDSDLEGAVKKTSISVFPMFGKPYEVEIEKGEGGHGGGDPVLLDDIFGEKKQDKYNRAASHIDGVWSILTGIGANKSIKTKMPILVDELIRL